MTLGSWLDVSVFRANDRTTYAGEQFIGIDRFDEVVVAAEKQARAAVVRLYSFA